MASPTLYGPNSLTTDGINGAVTQKSPGVYVLGDYVNGNVLTVKRVGRSKNDVNNRLHDYKGEYLYFHFAYCTAAYAAFLAECELWHDFGGADNPLHPDRDTSQTWTCPRCNNFG